MLTKVMIPEDLQKSMMRTNELVPYVGNAKKHPDWQVEQIANSIQAFGFNDPIGIWQDVADHWIIVEGHGRLLAAKELGLEEVPVIRLDHLDDEGRRAYTLAHNKLTMNTDFDIQILDSELDAIEGLDMTEFGFDFGDPTGEIFDDRFSDKVGKVEYEPSGREWNVSDLYELDEKYDKMIDELDSSKELKQLLHIRAKWLGRFKYDRIADYYANQATAEEQRVFEALALVLLDKDQLIANGFASLIEGI